MGIRRQTYCRCAATQQNKDKLSFAVEVLDGKVIEIVRKHTKVDSLMSLLKKGRYSILLRQNIDVNGQWQSASCRKSLRPFGKRERMKLLFLHPYSPNINPEEYFHNYLWINF